MSKIKILHVLEAMGGGTKKLLSLLVTHLNPNEFDITLALPPPTMAYDPRRSLADPMFPDLMRSKGFKVETIRMKGTIAPIADFQAFVALYSLIRKEKFDIVHTHSAKAGFIGRVAARLANVPVIIYSPYGLPFNEYISKARYYLYLTLERLVGRYSDLIIASSASELEMIFKTKIVPKSRTALVENCFDLAEYKVDFDTIAKKQDLGLRLEDPVIGTVARLTQQKGVCYLIDAAPKILNHFPNAQFILVGDGELRKDIEDQIGELNLSQCIHLLGNRQDYLEIMATFDLFVLPSLWEGMPYSPLEAMVLGKPVVLTEATGSRDIVRNKQTGVLVPPKDADALAAAIINLLENREFANLIAAQGKKHIEERFDISVIVEEITNLYIKLMKETGKIP